MATQNKSSPGIIMTAIKEYGTTVTVLGLGLWYFFGQTEQLQTKIDKSQMAYEVRMNEKIGKLEEEIKACEIRTIEILEVAVRENTAGFKKQSKQKSRIERVIKQDSKY